MNAIDTLSVAISDFISANGLQWSKALRKALSAAQGQYVDEVTDAYVQGREHGAADVKEEQQRCYVTKGSA